MISFLNLLSSNMANTVLLGISFLAGCGDKFHSRREEHSSGELGLGLLDKALHVGAAWDRGQHALLVLQLPLQIGYLEHLLEVLNFPFEDEVRRTGGQSFL